MICTGKFTLVGTFAQGWWNFTFTFTISLCGYEITYILAIHRRRVASEFILCT